MRKISIVYLCIINNKCRFFKKLRKRERKCLQQKMYLRWRIKAQNLYGWYWAVWRAARLIPRDSASDVVSNVRSVRKMGNELWQTDQSAGHRLRIQTKLHVAGRISLTSNPSANWHEELTPIATCQSPFKLRLDWRSQEERNYRGMHVYTYV